MPLARTRYDPDLVPPRLVAQWPAAYGVAAFGFALIIGSGVGLVADSVAARSLYAPAITVGSVSTPTVGKAPTTPSTTLRWRQGAFDPAAGPQATSAPSSPLASLGLRVTTFLAGLTATACAVALNAALARPNRTIAMQASGAARGEALPPAGPKPAPLRMNCRLVPKDEPGYKYLGMTEIPSIVPRHELVDSIQQWAANELREELEEKFLDFKLVVDHEDDQITEDNAYSLTLRYVAPSGDRITLECCLDLETIATGRTIEGFAVEDKEREIRDAEGNLDPRTITMIGTEGKVQGRYFMVRRKEGPMPDVLRPMVAESLKLLSMAVTRYYAFGSLFMDDAL